MQEPSKSREFIKVQTLSKNNPPVKPDTMMQLLDKVLTFINYWWFRYLMVTELYMVESWERVTIREYLRT